MWPLRLPSASLRCSGSAYRSTFKVQIYFESIEGSKIPQDDLEVFISNQRLKIMSQMYEEVFLLFFDQNRFNQCFLNHDEKTIQ